LEDLDIGKCVGCGAGLISVSEICPQCGLPKSKGAELEEAEKKVANDIELDESEEKPNNVEIENYEEFVEKVADKIKSNSSTKKPAEIKHKIFRPTGVRLLGMFHMFFGISLIVFALIAGSGVLLLVMSSGMGALGDIGGGSTGGMGNMLMLPGMDGIDPSTMSFLVTFIELNEITGSPSVSEIEQRLSSSGVMNMDAMMEIIGEAVVIVFVENALGISAVLVGRGLFTGKKWARPAIIGSSIISIPLAVMFVDNLDNLILLGMAAFDGLILYYMFKSKTREYFNQPSIKKSNKKSKIKTSRTVKKS
jgi:hypothetical protein